MIFYLTYNDAPSGIYSSQVIDVVKFIGFELKQPIKLIAFISFRNFIRNRKTIKLELNDAVVLPMFPGIQRWRSNLVTLKVLCSLWQPKKIIARSVLATNLALKCKKINRSIIYDGRGAIAAEWKEYGVITNTDMLNEISKLEHDAINLSDFRIAVSDELVKYWRDAYDYKLNDHFVIPCTLNNLFEDISLKSINRQEVRKKLGLQSSDVVFVYSGSIAGWQSFDLLYTFIKPILLKSVRFKILFLSSKDNNIIKLQNEFVSQVICKKVNPSQVAEYLCSSDFGLLIREQSTTNRVASPVKFAEYLACGLKIIISKNLGDYSKFTVKNNCGFIFENFDYHNCAPPSDIEINNLRSLALSSFSKKSFIESYRALTGSFPI